MRILTLITRIASAEFRSFLTSPTVTEKGLKECFDEEKQTSSLSVLLPSLIGSLKNANFMERRPNLRTGQCELRSFLWNDLILNRLHKTFQTVNSL